MGVSDSFLASLADYNIKLHILPGEFVISSGKLLMCVVNDFMSLSERMPYPSYTPFKFINTRGLVTYMTFVEFLSDRHRVINSPLEVLAAREAFDASANSRLIIKLVLLLICFFSIIATVAILIICWPPCRALSILITITGATACVSATFAFFNIYWGKLDW